MMTLVTVLASTLVATGLGGLLLRREDRTSKYLGIVSATLSAVELMMRHGGIPRFVSADHDAWLVGACTACSIVWLVRARIKAFAMVPVCASTLWFMVDIGQIGELG